MYEIYLIYANTIQKQESPSEKIHPNYTHYILRNLYIISVYTIYENTHICPPKTRDFHSMQQLLQLY